MNKVILGITLGAILGYCYRKMEERKQCSDIGEDVNRLAMKAKRKFKNAFDAGKNEVEYIKDRAEYGIGKTKDGLEDITQ